MTKLTTTVSLCLLIACSLKAVLAKDSKSTVGPNQTNTFTAGFEPLPKSVLALDSKNTLNPDQQKVFLEASQHLKEAVELEKSDKVKAKAECGKAMDGLISLNASLRTFAPATCVSIYTLEIECFKKYVELELALEDPSESQVPQYYVISSVNYGTIRQLYSDRATAYRHMNRPDLSAADYRASNLWNNKEKQREAQGNR